MSRITPSADGPPPVLTMCQDASATSASVIAAVASSALTTRANVQILVRRVRPRQRLPVRLISIKHSLEHRLSLRAQLLSMFELIPSGVSINGGGYEAS